MATADEMINNWGCNLVWRVYGKGSRSFNSFDLLIRETVPGFSLTKLTASGSEANQYAITEATDSSISRLLVGLGSYVGGIQPLQNLSSTEWAPNKALSIPKRPETASATCCEQTIVLPYYVLKTSLPSDMLLEYENSCLEALRAKLVVAALAGTPYKALLLEYILGGNGGELSFRFLECLGLLLKCFKMIVIADEILTAGRVGPSMTMTTTMPKVFLEVVEFITVGKVTDCGMVLRRASTSPVAISEQLRGTSTQMEAGAAYTLWQAVNSRLCSGVMEERRHAVLKFMNLKNKEHWGVGLLMYTSKTRASVVKGLKNRLLPMAELKAKLVKGRCAQSEWDADSLSSYLLQIGEAWILRMNLSNATEFPFVSKIVDKIASENRETIHFTDKEIEEYIGFDEAETMADSECKRVMKSKDPHMAAARCNKKALTFIRQATMCASKMSASHYSNNCHSPRPFLKKRLGHKRIETNIVDRRLLGYEIVVQLTSQDDDAVNKDQDFS